MDQSISLEEAAKRMQSTPLNVLMHVKRGLLTGKEKDGSWQIDATALEAFLAEKAEKTQVCASACSHKCPSCG